MAGGIINQIDPQMMQRISTPQQPGQLEQVLQQRGQSQPALNAPQNYAYGSSGSGNYGIFGGAYTPEEIQAIQAGGGYDSPGSLYRGQQILAGQQPQVLPVSPTPMPADYRGPATQPPVQTRPRLQQPMQLPRFGQQIRDQQPQDLQQRGLGGLQLNRFRRRLG